MNSNLAQAALAFMQRVQLSGEEVQAYQAVVAVLSRLAQEQEEPAAVIAEEADGAA